MSAGREQWDEMMTWLASIDHKHAKHARGQLVLLGMMREALTERDVELDEMRKRAHKAEGVLISVGAVLHVAGRAMRYEADVSEPTVAGLDCAPMRNLMGTVYGLTPLGGDKPPKKPRKSA